MPTPIPFSEYGSTRVDAAQQQRVNLYPHSQRGYRQFPGLVEFVRVPPVFSATVSAGVTPNGILFVNSGAKLFIHSTANTIDEWTLDSAYDIHTTPTATAQITDFFTASTVIPGSMRWSIDGLKIGAITTSGGTYSWSVQSASTAWDITSLTGIIAGAVISTAPTDANAFEIASDFYSAYAYDQGSGIIVEYAMSGGFSASVTATGNTYDTTGDSVPTGVVTTIRMSEDGRNLFLSGATGQVIYGYYLPNAYSIEDMIYLNSVDVSAKNTSVLDVTFDADGSQLFVADSGSSGQIHEYNLSPNYSVTAASGGSGDTRGSIVMDGVWYAVIGQTFYMIASTAVKKSLGTVTGTEQVGMSTDGTRIVITNGARLKNSKSTDAYVYTAAAGLVAVSDADLNNANTSAYLDSVFYYDQPNGQFVASDLNNPASIDPLEFATAESFGDETVAVFSHLQMLYVCGTDSIEAWLSTGADSPPVDRQEVIQRGLIGPRAIDSRDNKVYFLDNDRRPNVMSHLEYQELYQPGLGEEFDSYSVVNDCIVNCYAFQQEYFVEFRFPTDGKTWTFHETSNSWTKREGPSAAIFPVIYYERVYGELMGLRQTNVGASTETYKFDKTSYQDDGSNITRTIDTQIISSELFQSSSSKLALNGLYLTVESSGTATISASITRDLTTFETARSMTAVAGLNRLYLPTWGIFREAIIRITTTSNANVEIVEIAGDIEMLSA